MTIKNATHFIILDETLYALSESQKMTKISGKSDVLNLELPINKGNFLEVVDNKIILFNNHNLSIYVYEKGFREIYQEDYPSEINIYDTKILHEFICLCLEKEYKIINANTLQSKKFPTTNLVLETNGSFILEWNPENRNKLIYRNTDHYSEYVFKEEIADFFTQKLKPVLISKIIPTYSEDSYVVQAEYDYIYKIAITNGQILEKSSIHIENTYLGDTALVNNVFYHITGFNIYALNWENSKAEFLLNWESLFNNREGSGIKIIHIHNEVIIFLSTTRGIVLFYSMQSNKIIKYISLKKTFYTDCKSIVFEDKLYLIDNQKNIHTIPLKDYL